MKFRLTKRFRRTVARLACTAIVLSVLSGCGHKIGVEPHLSFSDPVRSEMPKSSQRDLEYSDTSKSAFLFGIDLGENGWLRKASSPFSSWQKLPGVKVKPKSSSDNVELLSCGESLLLVWSSYGNASDMHLHSLVSHDEGQTWTKGESAPIPDIDLEGFSPTLTSAAGRSKIFATSIFYGNQVNVLQSELTPIKWSTEVVQIPTPEGLPEDAKLEFDEFPVARLVDQKDRLHLLRKVSARTGSETIHGVTYLRSEDGTNFSSTFFESGRPVSLAADPTNADRLIFGTLLLDEGEEKDTRRPSRVPAVRLSEDGGSSWTAPIIIGESKTDWTDIEVGVREERFVVIANTERPPNSGLVPAFCFDSVDGGGSWSAPQKLAQDPSTWVLTQEGVMILGHSGEVLVGEFKK